VQLQVAVQELQPVQTLPLELVLKQQLVQVQVQVQVQVPVPVPVPVLEQEQARVLLLVQLVHCDRCSRVHLLV
jgi:NMD protein affecting ribosome stability and mRNA decay